VGRGHRTDDEEFYALEKKYFKGLKDFMIRTWEWVYYYNIDRPHDTLKCMTPYEELLNEELLRYFP